MQIQVPTINDGLPDFDCLFQLWNQVNDDRLNITFTFERCKFLRQNAVAFLGGLARLIEGRGGKVTFDWNSLQGTIKTNLSKNGFMHAFNGGYQPWIGNSIPYREDYDQTHVPNYLTEDWLGRGWITISPDLTTDIVSTVAEIYANAFEHGQSAIGVFSCGQYYPKLKELKLTTIDFGVGIPSNIRFYNQKDNLSASEALGWAFSRGNTTKKENVSRGLGLDLLSEFVIINKGTLEIFSHDGYVLVDTKQKRFEDRRQFFEGTLVNITLKCDESCYTSTSQSDDESPF